MTSIVAKRDGRILFKLNGKEADKFIEIMESNAKPNQYLKDAVARAKQSSISSGSKK